MGLILVTGGAGFIGSAFVRSLVSDGDSVAVLDDLSSGDPGAIPAGVQLVRLDIADPRTVTSIAELRPSSVVHAAAQVSVTHSVADPERDHAVNVAGTGHVLDGARAAGCRRFVFLSSGGAVYGEADGATEDTPPEPLSPYGRNKLAAERLVAESGIPYAIARLANVYGPGQRSDLEGGVVAIFAAALALGQSVTIFGDGEQSRDFVFVDDVVDGIRRLLRSPRSGTWNIGTGRPTTVHELLAAMERAAAAAIGHEHADAREGEVRTSRLGIELIERDIGWRPATSLDDGLRATLVADRGLVSGP
jgi:UDP-glucose 4-epimerase